MMRTFDTGATRDSDDTKLDYEGFLSPVVLRRFAEYMHTHRLQADGQLRASDNWQKGIPVDAYMKSLFRHFMELWMIHRTQQGSSRANDDAQMALCAVLFNVQGMLHELLKRRTIPTDEDPQMLHELLKRRCVALPADEDPQP